MLTSTKELKEQLDNLMDYVTQQWASADNIIDMKPEDLVGMQMVLGLIKSSEDLMIKQAEIIDSQNRKIDELLKIVKEMDRK